MKYEIFDHEVQKVIKETLVLASTSATKKLVINGLEKQIPTPYPSPTDWRDQWIYFLMTDRFNNPDLVPNQNWDQTCTTPQGGTFKGVQSRLEYLASLGVGAIWLTPIQKNWHPNDYHGYGIQNFMTIDGRFASDGTSATAEKELIELVDEAHARGIYIILDIVLNHSGRIFDYVINGQPEDHVKNEDIMNKPLGQEPPIWWLKGYSDPLQYFEGGLPKPDEILPGDAIWPSDLQRDDFFRRRGDRLQDKLPDDLKDENFFIKGDFGVSRQLVSEYDAHDPNLKALRNKYGVYPVLSILVQIYQYLIAKFDLDGFRIDTVKYIRPDIIEQFGNAIREFALSIGKKNFFTYGEVYDSEEAIAAFTGRNSSKEGFGIDAALDFPLFYNLPKLAKSQMGGEVENIRNVFLNRKKEEEKLLSSHGEASRYFVTFLDNHDQKERFNHPFTPQDQVSLGLSALFCLQGIPCLYYGTEQGLNGTKKDGYPDLGAQDASVREALWGKENAFNNQHPLYRKIKELSDLRKMEPALRYGRQYFREVSQDGKGFGQSKGIGGILAFSRILNNREVLFVANTNPSVDAPPFTGYVLIDADLNPEGTKRVLHFSNQNITGERKIKVEKRDVVQFYNEKNEYTGSGPATVLPIILRAMEVQIITPEFQMVVPQFLLTEVGVQKKELAE